MSKLRLNPNAPAFVPRPSPSTAESSSKGGRGSDASRPVVSHPNPFFNAKPFVSRDPVVTVSGAVPIRAQAPSASKGAGSSAVNVNKHAVVSDASNNDLRTSGFSRTPHKVNLDNFELIALIGDGMAGKVFQVRMRGTKKVYAMKVIRKKKVVEQSMIYGTQTERNILMNIDHPFINKLHFSFQTAKKFYMITDYLPGGDMAFHLNNAYKLPEPRVVFYAAEIALALAHLHSKGIIYRDLKAGNTLLDMEGHIRLTDFGVSKQLDMAEEPQKLPNSFAGTSRYMAPEVLNKGTYGTAVDWWSYGVLLYNMLTGGFPYDSENVEDLPDLIASSSLSLPNDLSIQARSLLAGLLNPDPSKRFQASDVKAHTFFNSIHWQKLEKKEVTPPWRPHLEDGNFDHAYFPSDFTDMTPRDSYADESVLLSLEEFTYTSPSAVNILEELEKAAEEGEFDDENEEAEDKDDEDDGGHIIGENDSDDDEEEEEDGDEFEVWAAKQYVTIPPPPESLLSGSPDAPSDVPEEGLFGIEV